MTKTRTAPFFSSISRTNSALDDVFQQAEANGLWKVSHHNSGCEGCSRVIKSGYPTGLSCSGRSDNQGFYMVVPANYRCSYWS